jgi:signal transduction histidine kinase
MTTQSWVTLIACAGELAVAVLVALRALRSPLAVPLLLLSVDLFLWNFAQLAWQLSGAIDWHLVDMIASPLGAALAFHFMLVFLGRSRQLRFFLWAAYGLQGVLAGTAALALVSSSARQIALSALWSAAYLACLFPMSVGVMGLLMLHRRRVSSLEERNRTHLLLAAVGILAPLASTELWADMGFAVPRLGSFGIFTFNALLTVAALRFRLFDRSLSAASALSAMILGAVGVIAYLSVFRFLGANTALLVLGTVTVTLALLAVARAIIAGIIVRREQLVRLATLGRLAAQMGHDLKNPLAALKGAAQFLSEERAQGRSIDDKTEFLDLLVEQIDRLKRAVDSYQRLGRVEPVRAPVQLNDLVRNLVTLQKFANHEQIAVKADLAVALPECPVDRDLVAGALENLLQNAFEATPRHSTVTVRTALARARQTAGVTLSVEDQGVGMSARTRERALDDFYTTKATGSGLGLAFVRRVAEAHGGEVSLFSKEGAGTTVHLFLPLE